MIPMMCIGMKMAFTPMNVSQKWLTKLYQHPTKHFGEPVVSTAEDAE
jgi:hypothetical protein